ncbi:MAG: FecR domain-containing protein [Bacteroidota bacterium]
MEKKYTNYDEIDFAEEPSFIRWVQGKDSKANAFWDKWANDHPQKSSDIKAAKVLVQAIEIKETEPSKIQIQNLWEKIDAATVEETKKTATIRTIGRRGWISVAAAACIGLIAFFTLYNPTETIMVGYGEQLTYTLPDNSTIDLNADSKITFKEGDFANDRIVNLEGEAFFEVQKGQSFKVITPSGMVEVLGTSFNVNTRDGNLTVDCRTGKVRVTAKGSEQILTKGMGTKLTADKSALEAAYETSIDQKIGWRNGEFYLEAVTLEQVIEELERQFAVTIEAPSDLLKKSGTYSFRTDNLEQAMRDITFQLNAEFEINGKNVIIRQ